MVEKKKGKLHNRLFFKIYANYAIMIVMFAIILSSIYLNMSEQNIIDTVRDRMVIQGETTSKIFTEYIVNKEYHKGLPYLGMLQEAGSDETWSVSNPAASVPMHSDLASITNLDSLLASKEYKSAIEGAFAGKKTTSLSYSEIHGRDVIIVGIPILGSNGEVCGALLLNALVDTETSAAIAITKSLVFSSAVFALIISFIIAIIFARQLSLPILRMRTTALALADQKFETKTGIKRKDEIGDLARTIDFLTDKLLENEQIRKNLEQMRLDFFANVSHELRTPITVVRAYTETLVDGVISDEDSKQQCYEKMLSECKSMERLVGDLLILSKMQNPDFVVEKEPVNVVQVFQDIIRALKALGEEKQIQLHLETSSEICLMYGDYDRLRQMFLIICDNAIKFSNQNSSIDIKIEKLDKLSISIRDQGIGISEKELNNIFEKFYKSKLRQNAKGSGLGLAIAKQIALKHGGSIEVNSELGVGTEFVFSFEGVTLEELEQ